ncbi:MAG: hypothetical protein GY793_03555 [Proteobacteria bacterium]|nr:hypothetical protein [Pseudomonadota bacterium]
MGETICLQEAIRARSSQVSPMIPSKRCLHDVLGLVGKEFFYYLEPDWDVYSKIPEDDVVAMIKGRSFLTKNPVVDEWTLKRMKDVVNTRVEGKTSHRVLTFIGNALGGAWEKMQNASNDDIIKFIKSCLQKPEFWAEIDIAIDSVFFAGQIYPRVIFLEVVEVILEVVEVIVQNPLTLKPKKLKELGIQCFGTAYIERGMSDEEVQYKNLLKKILGICKQNSDKWTLFDCSEGRIEDLYLMRLPEFRNS